MKEEVLHQLHQQVHLNAQEETALKIQPEQV